MERDLIRKFFLEANPNNDRRDCPDEATLKAIAENRLSLNDPARLHLASCSPCFAEFRGFRLEVEDRRRRRRLFIGAVGVAACLVLSVVLGKIAPLLQHGQELALQKTAQHPIEEAEVTRRIDLKHYVATRGVEDGAVQLDAVSLPAAIVHLELVLPRLSPAGRYEVAVSATRDSDKAVARGEGVATGSDPSTTLKVTLDLRRAPRGSYFLSTEREQDAGAYYFPLKLQ